MEYNLTTKSGEVISKCKAVSLDAAVQYFALRKNMDIDDLIRIYEVTEA